MMKRRLLAGLLTLIMVLQALAPGAVLAKSSKPSNNNLITIGTLTKKDYPQIDKDTALRVAREQKNKRKGFMGTRGATLFSTKSPYINGQQPADPDKPKYWANVQGTLTTRGIDGTPFDWDKVLGKGAKVKLLFTQTNGNVFTGVTYSLLVDKNGTYTWHGSDGKPTYLPLYDENGKPYTYNVQIERNFSEDVQLIIQESNGTPKAAWRQEGDKQVATISFIDIEIQQVASTKFVSEWHTGVVEANRPQIEGYFKVDDETDNDFNFPKNDTTRTILRSSFLENFVEDEDNGPWSFLASELETTPKTVEVKTDTNGLTFEENDGVKTVKSGDHKYKYDFAYDVINGGKLAMTEIIPVTFDANGGKFENFTTPDTETKIVKDVDYKEDLTEKAEDPKREGKTFKGWSTTAEGKTPATDDDFKNITEKKTFYAIWENNDIKAEELTVSESFNNGTKYVNDFIPSLDTLKGQVEIKDANGVYQELKDGDSLQILDDSGNPIADGDLKNNLYDKLKEDDATKVSRNVTLKAKVNFADGTSQKIEIPIKVIKNIYEGTSTGGKPSYVPADYVKVTVDPTDKATNPQKTYYYVNPAAKVVIPGSNPTGTGDNVFTKWLIDGTDTEYKFDDRHQFADEATIKAQFDKEQKGKIKIKYVDENGNEISADYHIDGVEYPEEKEGKLGDFARDADYPKPGPDFKGYIFNTRESIKGKRYKDPADPDNLEIVTYKYYKKVTTDTPSNPFAYFPVIFDANEGEFEAAPKDKKTVYVYFDGNDATVEKVTFKEVLDEFEKAYSNPTKDGFDFKEWQNAKTNGTKPADDYEIQFKGWNWDADPVNGYVPETFYAHYAKASALISYLDLDGKPIADTFKIDGVEYPTEKEGTAGEAIEKNVYTAETAPKLIGYKFNRIELNPKDGKYALDNKATIKIYYEKLPDVIPAKDGSGNPNKKPDGYVEVKFVPTDKAKDTTEKIFYVNPKKDVTIPIANPEAKATYTFKEWKMGAKADGAVYTPSTAQKFTEATTVITATYDETENIIPYDPSETDPMPRPKGYVRVTFAADPGLKLTEQKAYYVKKNAGIKLGNAELKKPAYAAQTGYKFKEWDKEDSLVIEAADILVTAKATKLENVIPEKDDKGNKNDKPEGYKEVNFVVKSGDETKGSIDGVAKFYVNPNEYVTIHPPEAKPNTGYEFGSWSHDATIPTNYKADTTITASFNPVDAVVPKVDDNTKKPEGYVTVTFELEKLDGKEVGEFASDATTVYYVNPNEKVYLLSPTPITKTGYKFKGWTPQVVLKRYSDDTIIKGRFEKLADIIPGGPEIPIPKGYVTVTFLKGNHGELSGQTVYYVNPEANKKMADITKPTVTPETGYTFDKWSIGDNTLIKNNQRPIAGYNTLDDVIPKTKDDDSEKPEDYITVTFVKGEHGQKLTGQAVYYVNPNKAVVLKDKAPTAVPNTGYDFAGWDTTIEKAIQYKDGDKITALYNEKGDVIPQEKPDGSDKPAGYLTVTFNKGDHGELSGKTVYYVKPNKEVTVPAPTVTPATGYEFKDWDKELTKTFTEDTKITAQYKDRGNIIPQEKTDGSDRPDGYFTVTFKADANGSLSGTTVYYVKPNTDIDLTNTAKAITKNPNVGYTAEGGTWSPEITSKQYTDNAEYTFNFNALGDVIPETNNDGTKNNKPDGYVTVKLIPTNKATAETKAEKIYFVNPTKNVTITNKPEGKKEKVGEIEYTYNFKGWTVTSGTIASWDNETIAGKFIQDTDITAQYKTNIDAGTILPAPVPKKNVVTPKGDTPEAKDLIKNIPGSETDPLPEGTKITYTDDGTPDVKNPGDTTAKVKIEYPGGKTVIVKVPITVVENVVPQKGNEKPKVPDNYVMVTFEIDGKGGKIADGETTIYYVNPKQEVTIPQPNTVANTGYKFDKWDPDTKMAQTYDKNTTVKGSFKGQKDIIPSTNEEGTPNEKPNGYVTVTFEKGANGSLEGQAVYYVNPNAGKTLADVTHPTIKPDTGFTANGWDKEDTTAISGTEDITVTAQYAPIDDVIPKDNPQGGENEKPDGYITVKFSTEKDGKIKGTDKTEKIVYVNPNKAVKLKGQDPEVTPNTGFTFADWDASIQREIKYQDNDVIKAKYNAIGDVIPQENPTGSDKPEGYLTVTFAKGEHGELSGTTVYYVKPNKEVTVPAPTVTPATGYVFKKWDQALTQTFTKDTTITAQYGNKPADPRPTTDYVVTELGVQPKPQDYEKAITPPVGKRIKDVQIVERPNVDKPGKTSATVKVIYEDGTTDQISVPVFVQKKNAPTPELRPYPVPGDCNNTCDQPNQPNQPNKPNQPNQPNVGKDALNTTDHYQYLIGYPDGNFAPNKGMTRAEAATMFTRLLNERPVKWRHYNAGLSDIRPGDWYANTVGYAVQRGIVSGYPDGSFKPNKPITRAEFAAIASRFDALAQGNAISFSDLAPSHWGYNAIRSAATKGWISGYPDNTFRPEQAITRAEVTAITNRMLNRHADLYWIDAHPSEVIRFGDVKRSDWYFEPIMEATMGHDFIRDRDKKTEHWTGINGKSFI